MVSKKFFFSTSDLQKVVMGDWDKILKKRTFEKVV